MEATKQFKFELAHRLTTSYSKKCQSIHGHSYLCRVTLKSDHLNDDGMVMDFGEVKDKLNATFDAWDHSLMLHDVDPLAKLMVASQEMVQTRLILVDYNPTAENMAYHIFRVCVNAGLPVEFVEIQETATGWAKADRLKPFVGETLSYHNIEEIKNA